MLATWTLSGAGLERLSARDGHELDVLSLQIVPVAGRVAEIAVEEPLRDAGSPGVGVLDAQFVQDALELSQLERFTRRRRSPGPPLADALAIDVDPDLLAVPARQQVIPDAHLGHRLGADPRLPLAQVQEEREVSAFARRIHAELIGALLDQQRLPARAEGIELGPAFDPQSRCRPEFRAVGHDHRALAALQALAAVAGRKGCGCCEGVVASPGPVRQIAIEAPDRHRGAFCGQPLSHRTGQDDEEHTGGG